MMTGYESKRAAAQDKLLVTDIDGHVVRDARKPKKAAQEREALKLALEVLKNLPGFRADIDNAITAIKEAQPQPVQEPVAWRYRGNLHEFDPSDWATGPVTPLYTAPPQRPWVGLTAEEAAECWTPTATQTWKNIENALRIKNT